MRSFRPYRNQRYLAFNKPFEILTQFTAPEGSSKQTLADFQFPPDVYPVGRLDYDSEGLLLLSDDSALNDALLNPAHGHSRTYLAQVEGIPSDLALKQLGGGVMIEGTLTKSAMARLLPEEPPLPPRSKPIRSRKDKPTSWLELTLCEGRNRQVRRMTAAVGYPTLRLVRVAIGELTLPELALLPGEWLELSHEQLLLAVKQ